MLKGFKEFIIRGNVVDLAVGVMIGAAFNSVVAALVKDLMTPLIAAIGGKHDFSKLAFTIRGSTFLYGEFINALISFLITAAAVYFFIVVPMNTFMRKLRRQPDAGPTTKSCPFCTLEIPIDAKRCPQCTSQLA